MKEIYEKPTAELIEGLFPETGLCAGSPDPGSNEGVGYEDW